MAWHYFTQGAWLAGYLVLWSKTAEISPICRQPSFKNGQDIVGLLGFIIHSMLNHKRIEIKILSISILWSEIHWAVGWYHCTCLCGVYCTWQWLREKLLEIILPEKLMWIQRIANRCLFVPSNKHIINYSPQKARKMLIQHSSTRYASYNTLLALDIRLWSRIDKVPPPPSSIKTWCLLFYYYVQCRYRLLLQ